VTGSWLTVAAVADELAVSPRTVLRWVDRGKLPAVRLPGGRLRIAEKELARRLDEWSTTTQERMLATVNEEGDGADG
jgi:excisionase family DNA binding protein